MPIRDPPLEGLGEVGFASLHGAAIDSSRVRKAAMAAETGNRPKPLTRMAFDDVSRYLTSGPTIGYPL